MASSTFSSERPDADGLPTSGELVEGRYEIRELIGVGGMGAVYAADDLTAGGAVALKIMLPREATQADAVKRFTREAEAARAIDSDHVARVFGSGRLPNGLPYICMELLEGSSLDRVQRKRGPLPIGVAIDFILQACEGVAAAHARGIIHRDLKPGNLHVTPGPNGRERIKVLDFGIAKATAALGADGVTLSLTETASTLGSPQYMSPEQLRSAKSVDARADIWSLGLILYRLLTGRAAFEGDSVGAVFAKVLADPPSSLRPLRPDAPIELEQAIMRCLERNVLHRFQDVAQLAEALAPFAPEQARHRPGRIRQILEATGTASPYAPLAPSQPRAVGSSPGTADGWPHGAAPWPAAAGFESGTTTGATRQSWSELPHGSSNHPAPGARDLLTATAATRKWSAADTGSTGDSFGAAASTAAHPASASRLPWLVAAAALVASAAVLGIWLVGLGGSVAATGGESAASPAATHGEGSAQSSSSEPTAAAEASATAGSAPGSDEAVVMVELALKLVPAAARVELDGEARTDNPLRIPRGSGRHRLVISALGYVTDRREVDSDDSAELEIVLRPAGRAGGYSTKPPKPTATAKGPMVDKL